MSVVRRCSRTACRHPAVCTLTYVYADSTAVVGPLATHVEPHCYDLCAPHAQRLTAPRGWEILRLPLETDPTPASDDLEALANAVREAARPPEDTGDEPRDAKRGHLRVVRPGDTEAQSRGLSYPAE